MCLWLLPTGFRTRDDGGPWSVLLPFLTTGFFSWLLVLTLVRDISLVISSLLLPPQGQGTWIRSSAITVMVLTPVITLIGFFIARRIAPVVDVEVPLADLPPQLEGFTIAQISDIHVGPTIKRNFVEAIVDWVNRLGADTIRCCWEHEPNDDLNALSIAIRSSAHHAYPFPSAHYGWRA